MRPNERIIQLQRALSAGTGGVVIAHKALNITSPDQKARIAALIVKEAIIVAESTVILLILSSDANRPFKNPGILSPARIGFIIIGQGGLDFAQPIIIDVGAIHQNLNHLVRLRLVPIGAIQRLNGSVVVAISPGLKLG